MPTGKLIKINLAIFIPKKTRSCEQFYIKKLLIKPETESESMISANACIKKQGSMITQKKIKKQHIIYRSSEK